MGLFHAGAMMRPFKVEVIADKNNKRSWLMFSSDNPQCAIMLDIDSRSMFRIEEALIELEAECVKHESKGAPINLSKCRCGDIFNPDFDKQAIFYMPQLAYLCLKCQSKRLATRLS